VPPYLAAIVAAHRTAAAGDRRDRMELEEAAMAAPVPSPFTGALIEAGRRAATGDRSGIAVIAEIKRRSPSKGDLAPGLDPASVAGEYARGGAACLSVLTDREFFGGSPEDLVAAKSAAGVPVLRKDFTVSANDVCDARLMGADAVLLIAAALDDGELAGLLGLSARLGLDAMVEVHSEEELARALAAGARFVGVNQRDLSTFAVDPTTAERLAASIPAGVLAVAESGIRHAADVRRMAAAGYEAVLVGESLVTSPDRVAAVRGLCGAPVSPRKARQDAAR
jgi:indole-3-glycerol phosphate synthase